MICSPPKELVYFSRLLTPLGLLVVFGIACSPASSQAIESSNCPVAWLNAIEKVAIARAQLPEDATGILFGGFDGEIYNCLDEQVPTEELEQIKYFERSLAQIQADIRAENQSEQGGYCDCGFHTTQSGYGINICNLPYERIEVNSENCSNRLELFLKHLQSK